MRSNALPTAAWGLVVAAACGGTSPVTAWLGDWGATGTKTVVCSDAGVSSPVSGSVTISAGAGSDAIEVAIGGCTLAWDVDGGAASVAATASCPLAADAGSPPVSYRSGAGSLGDNTMTLDVTGATAAGCTVTEALDLTRDIRPSPMR